MCHLCVGFFTLTGNGRVYGVVWRFEAQTCQTATPFIICNTLKISTIRQMHYTRCYQLAFIHYQSISCQFCSNQCVGTDTLFDKFWSCGWIFERLGNVCGCEALALKSFTFRRRSFVWFNWNCFRSWLWSIRIFSWCR